MLVWLLAGLLSLSVSMLIDRQIERASIVMSSNLMLGGMNLLASIAVCLWVFPLTNDRLRLALSALPLLFTMSVVHAVAFGLSGFEGGRDAWSVLLVMVVGNVPVFLYTIGVVFRYHGMEMSLRTLGFVGPRRSRQNEES